MQIPARRAAVPFILITLLLDVLGLGLIIPVLPSLVVEFQGGDVSSASRWYGLFGSSYALMQFVFSPLMGSLSDSFGRRRVILVSLFGAGIDYVLMALAPSLAWLFVGRLIAGITASNFSAANAYIADVTPPEKRAQSFGLIGAVFGVGFILGPALGGVLGSYGPRWPFWGAAGLALTNGLYGYFVLPESNPIENRRPFTVAGLNPLRAMGILGRYPVVLALTATHACVGLAHQCLQSTWVLYTTYRYDWTVKQNGLSLMAVGMTGAIVQGGLVRWIIPRLGETRALVAGLSIGGFAFVLYGLATQGWMMYAIIVAGALGGISMPASQALVSRAVSPTEQGAVQGALSGLFGLTGIAGPMIATSLFGWSISDAAPIKIPGSAFFLGSLLMFLAVAFARRAFRLLPAAPSPNHLAEPSRRPALHAAASRR